MSKVNTLGRGKTTRSAITAISCYFCRPRDDVVFSCRVKPFRIKRPRLHPHPRVLSCCRCRTMLCHLINHDARPAQYEELVGRSKRRCGPCVATISRTHATPFRPVSEPDRGVCGNFSKRSWGSFVRRNTRYSFCCCLFPRNALKYDHDVLERVFRGFLFLDFSILRPATDHATNK